MSMKRIVTSFAITLFICLLTITPAHAQKSMIGMTTMAIGSSGHVSASAAAEILKQQTGAKVRVIPIAAQMPRVNLLRSGQVQFAFFPGNALYNLQTGIQDFAKIEWGPQPLRVAYQGASYLAPLTTKKHEDINTIADAKGKRVTTLKRKSSYLLAQSMWAFGGLTRDDVKQIPVPGYTAQIKALMAGQVDVASYVNPASSILYEAEASPRGIKWLSLPMGDTEAWKRLRSFSPEGAPAAYTVTAPGLKKGETLGCFAHAYAFVAYEDQDPDLVYLLVKTIWENHDRLQAAAKPWKVYTKEIALSTKFPHVFHKGAIRYYKEKGLWTSELEEWNQKQIGIQKKLKDRWEVTLDEALEKKWKPKMLEEEWNKRQMQITGYEVPK